MLYIWRADAPKDNFSILSLIFPQPISPHHLIIKTPSSKEWWIPTSWKNDSAHKSFVPTVSPKQLILLQSGGIRPTMALTIKASHYLWSKSRALLLNWACDRLLNPLQNKNNESTLFLCFQVVDILQNKRLTDYIETKTLDTLFYKPVTLMPSKIMTQWVWFVIMHTFIVLPVIVTWLFNVQNVLQSCLICCMLRHATFLLLQLLKCEDFFIHWISYLVGWREKKVIWKCHFGL